jgi:hypothetical protein
MKPPSFPNALRKEQKKNGGTLVRLQVDTGDREIHLVHQVKGQALKDEIGKLIVEISNDMKQ